jgi:hypothetical protein
MSVLQLIVDLQCKVPANAPVGTRYKLFTSVTNVKGKYVAAAAARIDKHGKRREQFWLDGIRVERAVLLRLTCAEAECPHAVAVRAQWLAFQRQRGAAVGTRHTPLPDRPGGRPLMTEVLVQVRHQRFVARPASFPCFTPCPHRAHAPLVIHKRGYDLFEDEVCLGGGVTDTGGVRRPRIPDLHAAEAFVMARQFETMAALARVSEPSSRDGRPRPEST